MTTIGTNDDLDICAQRIADAAPELTDYQRERLAPLLRPAAPAPVVALNPVARRKKAAA